MKKEQSVICKSCGFNYGGVLQLHECNISIKEAMKQPSDYQEVDKIVESFFTNEITFGETKEKLHSELDRVREETIRECLKAIDTAHDRYHREGYCNICGSGSRGEGMSFYKNQLREALNHLAKDNK